LQVERQTTSRRAGIYTAHERHLRHSHFWDGRHGVRYRPDVHHEERGPEFCRFGLALRGTEIERNLGRHHRRRRGGDADPQAWNFATTAFTGTKTEYSVDGSTGWAISSLVSASNVRNVRYVRVTATVSNLPLYLIPVIGVTNAATVKAQAVAGITLEGTSAANPLYNGEIFPYSPIVNVDATNSSQLPTTGDPFGYTVGQQYDLKWPNSATVGTVGADKVPCAGDDNQAAVNREAPAGSAWGEVVYNSAASIYTAIVDNTGQGSLYINQTVSPTTGDKGKEVSAFDERVAQDTDQTSTTLATYNGNGRRYVTVMVNSGFANAAGVAYPASGQAIGLGYAEFLLLPDYSHQGGSNDPFCAIYVGPSPTVGSPSGGGAGVSTGTNGSGVGVIRLLQ
jgi:hypothetical protein